MKQRDAYTRRAFIRGAVALAFAAPTLASQSAGALENSYFVNSGGLRLRSGPGLRFGVLGTLAHGTLVGLLEWGGRVDGYEWVKVRVSSTGQLGWVVNAYLSPYSGVGFAIGAAFHVDTAGGGGANLRAAPGTSSSVLRVIPNGLTGGILDGPRFAGTYAWYKVSIAGLEGWMATAVMAGGPGNPGMPLNVTVLDGPLNVRNRPTLAGGVVGQVRTGDRGWLTQRTFVVADGHEWAEVTFQRGPYLYGWVAKRYVSIT